MCGISGIIDFKKRLSEDDIKKYLFEFNSILNHRGPDNSGIYINKNIGLAQTRLSIIDLSKNGNQPMISKDKISESCVSRVAFVFSCSFALCAFFPRL